MYHVELKQSIHSARRFNLSRAELEAEYVSPWLAGQEIGVDEFDYNPKRAKIKIVEARALDIAEMGVMGRGWQVVEKAGEIVTDEIMNAARAGVSTSPPTPPAAGSGAEMAEFKSTLLGSCSLEARSLSDVVRLAGVRHPGVRASTRLELAERSVWELLHQQQIALYEDGSRSPVPPERWEELVLAWDSWEKDTPLSVQAL